MGNIIMSGKETKTSDLVKEPTKSINYTAIMTSLVSFSYIFNSFSSSSKLSFHKNQRKLHRDAAGLRIILNFNEVLVDKVLIRKRKVTKILPIFRDYKFLFCCYCCNKDLKGQDIYIYREWSFCSADCRIESIQAKLGKPQVKKLKKAICSQTIAGPVTFFVGDN